MDCPSSTQMVRSYTSPDNFLSNNSLCRSSSDWRHVAVQCIQQSSYVWYGLYFLTRDIQRCSYSSLVTYSSNDRTTWIAHVNTTQSTRGFAASGSSTTSTTNLLCLKESNSATNPVIFNGIGSVSSSNAETGTITNAWSLYGSTVLINRPGGNFYAKSTGEHGWWQLAWSTLDSAGLEATAIILRTYPPVLA